MYPHPILEIQSLLLSLSLGFWNVDPASQEQALISYSALMPYPESSTIP